MQSCRLILDAELWTDPWCRAVDWSLMQQLALMCTRWSLKQMKVQWGMFCQTFACDPCTGGKCRHHHPNCVLSVCQVLGMVTRKDLARYRVTHKKGQMRMEELLISHGVSNDWPGPPRFDLSHPPLCVHCLHSELSCAFCKLTFTVTSGSLLLFAVVSVHCHHSSSSAFVIVYGFCVCHCCAPLSVFVILIHHQHYHHYYWLPLSSSSFFSRHCHWSLHCHVWYYSLTFVAVHVNNEGGSWRNGRFYGRDHQLISAESHGHRLLHQRQFGKVIYCHWLLHQLQFGKVIFSNLCSLLLYYELHLQ